jgi:hypothetical protein
VINDSREMLGHRPIALFGPKFLQQIAHRSSNGARSLVLHGGTPEPPDQPRLYSTPHQWSAFLEPLEHDLEKPAPDLTPQVGFTRLAPPDDAKLGQARVSMVGTALREKKRAQTKARQ